MAMLENQPEEPGIVNEVLGFKRLVFVAPNEAPYKQITHPLPIETLLTWPMIIYEWESGRHMVGNRHFRERYGLSLQDHNMIACFDTHEAMMEGVKAGLGWATVPECIYARYRDDQDIVRFRVNTAPMWYPVSIAASSERIPSDAARGFARFIRSHIPEGYFRNDIEAYLGSRKRLPENWGGRRKGRGRPPSWRVCGARVTRGGIYARMERENNDVSQHIREGR